MRKLLFGLIVFAAWAGVAEARPPSAPAGYDPASGRVLPTPAKNWLTGECVQPPKPMPVVGTAVRTSHFSNPLTGQARYKQAALDPSTGTVATYKFRK